MSIEIFTIFDILSNSFNIIVIHKVLHLKLWTLHLYCLGFLPKQNACYYSNYSKKIKQPDTEKSGSRTFKNIKSEQKCQVRINMNQVRASINFAMKHNPQTYLNNDEYNNPKSEMSMFKPLG